MPYVVQDFIAAEIAKLERIVPVPLAPFGYGTDLSCVSDVTADFAETDPESIQGIAEMLVRWLTTDRGSNPDAPDRGFNIRRLLGKGMTVDEIRSAKAQITNEATEDDRLASVVPTLDLIGLKQIKVHLLCVPRDPALGDFELVVAVTPDETIYELLTGAI